VDVRGRRPVHSRDSLYYVSANRPDTASPFDPDTFPLVDPYPPFSWLRPDDAAVIACLDADSDADLAVLADDCGHVEDYGSVTTTPCGLHLCWDCAATHTCPACDADARDHADPDD
jgi:hypothetical protein